MLRRSVVLLWVVVACATADLLRGVVTVDDKDVKEVVDTAVQHINKQLPGHFHHKLVKICSGVYKISTQDLDLKLIVGETTCKKQEVTYEEAKQCDIKEGASAYKMCLAILDKFKKVFFACHERSKDEC